MKLDLVRIIASLMTLKDEIEDSNNRQRMELEEVIDELERMVLDDVQDKDLKHFADGFHEGKWEKDMPDNEDAMGMYPWHNKPHEEEG